MSGQRLIPVPSGLVHPAGVSRRGFLGGAAVGVGGALATDMRGVQGLRAEEIAGELRRGEKHVILLWLAGGASQLETWDPKPGAKTGGPFAAIPTNVSGIQVSELLPKLAQRMHLTAIIRSLNTKIADHGGGADLMERGRRDDPGLRYPDLGAVVAKELGRLESTVPDYVSLYTSTEGRRKGTSGFLGARYAPLFLAENMAPPNTGLHERLTAAEHQDRAALRDLLS